jgi:ribonucleotide reductase alpha subunit
MKYGTRNSLLTTIMPTASTSQIMNNNESIEPYTTNLYVRKTMAGEFIIVNKHLVKELQMLGVWNQQLYNELLFDNGSVQKLDISDEIKSKYKTAFELKQSSIIKQSIDRGVYIDQSQSLNLFISTPNFSKLHSCHFYGWRNGLKTGMYYLRSQPAMDAIKFGIDPKTIDEIKNRRKDVVEFCSLRTGPDNEPCMVCSA